MRTKENIRNQTPTPNATTDKTNKDLRNMFTREDKARTTWLSFRVLFLFFLRQIEIKPSTQTIHDTP